jgi:hypothetical protein
MRLGESQPQLLALLELALLEPVLLAVVWMKSNYYLPFSSPIKIGNIS